VKHYTEKLCQQHQVRKSQEDFWTTELEFKTVFLCFGTVQRCQLKLL